MVTKNKYSSFYNLNNVIQEKMKEQPEMVSESFSNEDVKNIENWYSSKNMYSMMKYYDLLIERLNLNVENYAPNWKQELLYYFGENLQNKNDNNNQDSQTSLMEQWISNIKRGSNNG